MRFGITCVVAVLLATSCKPIGISDEIVEISGEFLPGSRCSARAPRGALSAADTARTRYRVGALLNVAPAGFTIHTISCGIAAVSDSAGVTHPGGHLSILLAMPDSASISPGSYRVIAGGATDADVSTVQMAFWHPAYDVGKEGSGSVFLSGSVYLVAVSGTLELSRIDPPTWTKRNYADVESPMIEGRFVVNTRREWSK